MIVLDVCVGSEKMYFDMNKNLNDSFVSIDIRKEEFINIDKNGNSHGRFIIKPTILADMKKLPFIDKIVDIIVMDPPHMQFGKTSFMIKIYGSWNKEEKIRSIYYSNIEFNRVLKDNGILIIKIMPEDKDRYISIFTNFCFFLPIQTIRQEGRCNDKKSKEAAIWLIGIKKND